MNSISNQFGPNSDRTVQVKLKISVTLEEPDLIIWGFGDLVALGDKLFWRKFREIKEGIGLGRKKYFLSFVLDHLHICMHAISYDVVDLIEYQSNKY